MSEVRMTPTASWSGPFWEGIEQNQLRYQRCDGCTAALFPPRKVCPHCASNELLWDKSSGEGIIYTFTEIERGAINEFKDQVPYVVGVVELDEGFRMTTRLVGFDGTAPACDIPVTIVFDDPVVALPCFRPMAAYELARRASSEAGA